MSSNPTCASCPAWNHTPDADIKTDDGNVRRGQCRLHPPVNIMMPIRTLRGDEIGVNGFWPVTGADQWCAEHPRRRHATERAPEAPPVIAPGAISNKK